jgi:hypothetical protein
MAYAQETAATALRDAFEQTSAMRAPTRSLHMHATENLAKDVFRDHNVLVFGELHHSSNYKFLADNPAFLREAAAQGGKHLYIELHADILPLTRAYFANEIDEDLFIKEIETFYREDVYMDSAPPEDHARQFIALCKVAKSLGMEVLPSDFRTLNGRNSTSDVMGVPDIMNHDDEVRRHTLRTLEAYTAKTGKKIPITKQDRQDFYHMHINTLPPVAENSQFWLDTKNRVKEWARHNTQDKEAAHQNKLQARYAAQTSAQGEKMIFVVGSRHFAQKDSIGEYATQAGLGPIIGIELLAPNGILWRTGLESAETAQLYKTGHQFSYRIHTEECRIFNLQKPVSVTAEKVKGPV